MFHLWHDTVNIISIILSPHEGITVANILQPCLLFIYAPDIKVFWCHAILWKKVILAVVDIKTEICSRIFMDYICTYSEMRGRSWKKLKETKYIYYCLSFLYSAQLPMFNVRDQGLDFLTNDEEHQC